MDENLDPPPLQSQDALTITTNYSSFHDNRMNDVIIPGPYIASKVNLGNITSIYCLYIIVLKNNKVYVN